MTEIAPSSNPNAAAVQSVLAQLTPAVMEQTRGRLADRGIDPSFELGKDDLGVTTTTTGLYVMLGAVAATEKAGQNPTYAVARLALQSGLPSEVADTLFLAYNQQSAEEAGHGDKVFGNAYFAMGGTAPDMSLAVLGGGAAQNGGPSGFLAPGDDPKLNKKRLGGFAGVLGGIETVALQRAFPTLVRLCEAWDHPVARDLLAQIRDVVRPEESRHVLLFRYVFHQLIAGKGDAVIEMYRSATNTGRTQLGADALDTDAFLRLMGSSSPTPRQLLGKDRAAFA
jgi:hypothetical protein